MAMHPFFERPEFWAAHYEPVIGTDEEEGSDFLKALFGVEPDVAFDFYSNELIAPDGTAARLAMPVTKDASVAVEFADCGDDGNELRYSITMDSWDDWELVGYDSPHFALPAFRWEEVEAIGRHQPAALLLLLPSVRFGEKEPGHSAIDYIENAWRQLNLVSPKAARTISEHAVENLSGWDLQWSHDPALGWINDGEYSFRNPETRMTPFSRERFQRIASFLRAVDAAISTL